MRLMFAAARLIAAVGLCSGLSLYHAAAGRTSNAALPEPFDAAAMDRRADACSDFFRYATGSYRAAHPIPPAYTEYGYIEELVDKTRDIVRDIIVRAQKNPGRHGSEAQKIGTFYSSCMDTATIERRGLSPLSAELARIGMIRHTAELPMVLAHLHTIGVDAGFALNPTPDIRNSSSIIAQLDQAGIGLPERDYYVRSDAASRTLRRQYTKHVAHMLRLSGDGAAAVHAQAIVALETRFAGASKPIADLREPEATYHPLPASTVFALAPHAGLREYLAATNIRVSRLNVAEPDFVRAFDRTLVQTPLATWKSYLRWRLIDTYAVTLPARFEDENFAFRERILNGAQTQLPRWKRCVNSTNVLLGGAVGQRYVVQTFGPDAKRHALDMTLRIKSAYRAEISALTWMTPVTKQIAIAKLDAMGLKVGYPAVWRTYATFDVRSDSYAANVMRGQTAERRYQIAKIGRPVNRSEWFMTPQTVNAYNDTQRNEIVLPAAQLQRPFYDPLVDDAANLGATGAGTIGHEMTHGFDDEGHKFDARGNVRNWWTARDVAQFNARAACVIKQFDRTVAVGSIHYQGRLVSGEAIADLGGLIIGYRALQTSLRSMPPERHATFTPAQRYFLSFAQSWSEENRPEAARTEALGDPHPLPRDRVNQTVANVPAWYDAFNCPKPARPICEIW